MLFVNKFKKGIISGKLVGIFVNWQGLFGGKLCPNGRSGSMAEAFGFGSATTSLQIALRWAI